MLDIKWIRENQTEFAKILNKRGLPGEIAQEICQLDQIKRENITLLQQLQQERNAKSKLLANIKDHNSKEFLEIKHHVKDINTQIQIIEEKLQDTKLDDILDNLPNTPDDDVPFGQDEKQNQLIREWFSIHKNSLNKQHFELGEYLGLMDFETSAKISGSRFVLLKGSLAKLERALINFMLDIHTNEFGFNEISPPYLVKPQALYNVGQLPKFAEDSFVTTNDYRLIPTAEVPLTNIVANSIIPREQLPLRYTAYTPCFRSEAGSGGRDTRGMIRMHQFSKVELVSITTPEESKKEHEYLTNAAEEILRRLDLSYRVMLLCSGDMGFSAQKTYDLEVWLPGQNQYREISSCSNCGNFQAVRMKARYKEFASNETQFVHSLNGSALAVGRTIVAILENYQDSDGSIVMPTVLIPYMNGQTRIMREEIYT